MKFTKHETEVDSNGIMHEVVEAESNDGSFGYGIDLIPTDIYKVITLVDFCRLRYSEINGVPCTDPLSPGSDRCSDPKQAAMTGVEWQLDCEKCELSHIRWGFENCPDAYNISGFKETHLVLEDALVTFHNCKVWNKELNDKLANAIKIGNKYLTTSGVKINQKIEGYWVIQQPIQVQE